MFSSFSGDNTHIVTLQETTLLNVLQSPIEISCFELDNKEPLRQQRFATNAIWDTGARASVITQEVVNALKLEPTGRVTINTASQTGIQTATYSIILHLNTELSIVLKRVALGKIATNIDCLIGMDVISMGDFSVTNFENRTCMSFRFPSKHHLDYCRDPKLIIHKL